MRTKGWPDGGHAENAARAAPIAGVIGSNDRGDPQLAAARSADAQRTERDAVRPHQRCTVAQLRIDPPTCVASTRRASRCQVALTWRMPIRQSDPTTNSLLIRATRIDPYASLFDGTESSAACQRLQAGVPISAWVGYCNTELRLFERLSGFCRDKNDWLSNAI